MSSLKNPGKKPIVNESPFTPPPAVVRPRNGERTGDALGTDAISGHDGGGKSAAPFIPVVDRTSFPAD
jgi:hypothetical protein